MTLPAGVIDALFEFYCPVLSMTSIVKILKFPVVFALLIDEKMCKGDRVALKGSLIWSVNLKFVANGLWTSASTTPNFNLLKLKLKCHLF